MPTWKKQLSLFFFINLTSFGLVTGKEINSLSLPISSEDVYSIFVTPNKSHGASRYRLQIFSSEQEKKPIIDMIYPLHGKISNVEIFDIDKDSAEELVIQSTKVAGTGKVHYDIFELSGRSFLDKIKIFLRL